MSRASEVWQHQQLEPTERLRTGNAKRWGLLTLPERKRIADVQTARESYNEEQDNRAQDEYLESKGVPVGTRT